MEASKSTTNSKANTSKSTEKEPTVENLTPAQKIAQAAEAKKAGTTAADRKAKSQARQAGATPKPAAPATPAKPEPAKVDLTKKPVEEPKPKEEPKVTPEVVAAVAEDVAKEAEKPAEVEVVDTDTGEITTEPEPELTAEERARAAMKAAAEEQSKASVQKWSKMAKDAKEPEKAEKPKAEKKAKEEKPPVKVVIEKVKPGTVATEQSWDTPTNNETKVKRNRWTGGVSHVTFHLSEVWSGTKLVDIAFSRAKHEAELWWRDANGNNAKRLVVGDAFSDAHALQILGFEVNSEDIEVEENDQPAVQDADEAEETEKAA